MMHPYLNAKAAKDIEEGFERTRRAWKILELVVSEWETDPSSVTCFDLRIVAEAKLLIKNQRKSKDPFNPLKGEQK